MIFTSHYIRDLSSKLTLRSSTSTEASNTSTTTLFSLQVRIKYAIADVRKDCSLSYRTIMYYCYAGKIQPHQ